MKITNWIDIKETDGYELEVRWFIRL
jgi:hypothetical protein